MFNAISKIVNPTAYMPDGKAIAKKISSINKFEDLTHVKYLDEVHIPTMDDLYLGIMRAQSSIACQTKESDKVEVCIRAFEIVNEFMNCVDMNRMKVNRLFSVVSAIDSLAIYIALHGTAAQKEEILGVYNRVLDAAVEYHDHVYNVRRLMSIISEIESSSKKEIAKKGV